MGPDYYLGNYIRRFAVGPGSLLRTARSESQERRGEDKIRSYLCLHLHEYDPLYTTTARFKSVTHKFCIDVCKKYILSYRIRKTPGAKLLHNGVFH